MGFSKISIFLTGALGPRGPGARGPWGPGALGPRYYYQGLGAHGPWGPGALGPRYYYQGPGAPGVCPTNYGGPCIWRVNKVNELPHMLGGEENSTFGGPWGPKC